MAFLDDLVATSPLLAWLAVLPAVLLVEAVFRGKLKTRAILRNGAAGMVVLLAATAVAAPLTGLLTAWASEWLGTGWIDARTAGPPTAASVAGTTLAYVAAFDFFYYWWHRSQHSFGLLWEQHSVHHSETEMNGSTFIKQHYTEVVFEAALVNLPLIVLFKFDPVTNFWISTLVTGWNFVIHMDVPVQIGRFSWVVTGPQLHRIHHSSRSEHADKNFAAYLPLWDILFGTYFAPRRDEFPETGLSSGDKMDDLPSMLAWPMNSRYLAKTFGRSPPPASSADARSGGVPEG